MDREKLFRQMDRQYSSKRDMITRIPLGVQPDALWQELLNRRRSRSTVLPLYNCKGAPYWYVTTEKMVAASEKIIETLYDTESDFDPYTDSVPISSLEEVFYTSYVDGSQITIQDAMNFLTDDRAPRDIEEQLIANNRMAAGFASGNLYRLVDENYMSELVGILTDGMDEGGQDYRSFELEESLLEGGEVYEYPPPYALPGRAGDLCGFLASKDVHPLVKAAVAQGYISAVRPFPEGNERLGRILSSVILIRAGYTFFGEVSLSSLIARKSYAYYEAVANILREENGGDLTYFIEYFLDLLSRAVDERKLKAQRDEKSLHESESELARIPLIPPSEPQHEAVEHPEESAETNEPTDTQPIEITDIETLYSQTESIGYTPTQSVEDDINKLRLIDKLYLTAETGSPHRKMFTLRLLNFIDKGIDSFTIEDILTGCEMTQEQAGNLINRFKDKGLIESCDRRVGKLRLYRFGRNLEPLKPDDYSQEILRTISSLLNSHKSPKDRRLGELIFSCIHKGLMTHDDYAVSDNSFHVTSELSLLEQMGILTKLDNGMYRINRAIPEILPPLHDVQREAVNSLYQNFHDEPFNSDMVITSLHYSKGKTHSILRQLTMLGILEKQESSTYTYRLLVNPNDNPEYFTDDDIPGHGDNYERNDMYSERVYEQLDILANSSNSSSDRRLAENLRRCLAKGTLLQSDYEAWNHSECMWKSDTDLALQLGLISPDSSGGYTINRDVSHDLPVLRPRQKKTVTEIFDAFGCDNFSWEMYIATLNYSESHAYATLHKLTLLRILGQKKTDEGSSYQLLVNPDEHPECFATVA